MIQLLSAYLPIVILIYLMTKRDSMPSQKALPLTALLTYILALVVYQRNPNDVHAVVLEGLLVAFTPISIIAGAIFLFRTMEATGALLTIKGWLNTISDNKVAQLLIVGWAFQFLIEGASGFGTPAAIAAPVLVGLGFPAVRVAIFCLVMNSVPVSFGAVGAPIWFGLSTVPLTEAQLSEISVQTALFNSVAALPVVLVALFFVVDFASIKRNFIFIVLAVACSVIPYTLIATLSYEFPSLLGGSIGLILCVLLAKLGIGLAKHETSDTVYPPVRLSTLLKATFPLWGSVLLLAITRIPQLGIKPLLVAGDPALSFSLGSLGDFSISAALVVSLNNIFQTSESWSHSLLYVPSILPFVVISLATYALYKNPKAVEVGGQTLQQMKNPALALFGALIFVNLVMMGGQSSAVTLIGKNLAAMTGNFWQFFAPLLGALGSFFSGSATISNLTFAGIQASIADDLGLDLVKVLSLQSAGAAMGNMVCINNIVAVASVLGLQNKEGEILKKTVLAMLVYASVLGVMGVIV